jgi:O-antigen ligase
VDVSVDRGRRAVADPQPSHPIRGLGALRAALRRSEVTVDFALLGVLFVATAVGGRPLTKLHPLPHVYVTELVVAATIVAAAVRVGVRGVIERCRRAVWVLPLLVYWTAGAIAELRGLRTYGASMTLHDIGLVEYSIFVPLVAVVADTRRRLWGLLAVLAASGLAATVVYAVVYLFYPAIVIGPADNPEAAVGIYLALAGLPVLVRLGQRLWMPPAAIVVAFVALFLLWLTGARTLAAALSMTAVVLVLLAGRRRHVPTLVAAVFGLGLSLGAALAEPWAVRVTSLVHHRGAGGVIVCAALAAFALVVTPRRAARSGAVAAVAVILATVLVVAVGEQSHHVQASRNPATTGQSIVSSVGDSFNPNAVSGDNANTRWRIAYWRYTVKRTLDEPLLGVGFGTPADFRWSNILYDARVGNGADPNDLTPPHNSFLNILFRTGLVGFVPLVVLVAGAVLRTLRRLRNPSGAEERFLLLALLGCFCYTTITACLDVALEGPYMSMFFWSMLALLWIVPGSKGRPGLYAASPPPRVAPS